MTKRAYRRHAHGACAILLTFGLGAFAASGCREKTESWDNMNDCDELCDRYSECFAPNYNVESCQSRCFDHAQVSLDYEFQVDRCATCMRDLTCELIEVTECLDNCEIILDEPVVASANETQSE